MRKILHVDLDAFFCSVEEILDSSLKGVAFSTGGSLEGRGVVTSCSYAARMFGVRSAMPMRTALRLCPHLIPVRGHYRRYSEYSTRVMDILNDITPLVQPISIDEAFLDVTDLPQDIKTIARNIQTRIKNETGLPCSIGGATNKLIAKIATNIGKANHKKPTPPMAIKIVSAGREEKFLKPLPVQEMWGIGSKTAKILKDKGINIIGDIQSMPLSELEKLIGNFAAVLKKRSHGIDQREVGNFEGVKSISNERTFFENLTQKSDVYMVIKDLSEKVAQRLRHQGLSGKTIRLKLRWPNFETVTRQLTLEQSTNHDSIILSSVRQLLDKNWVEGKGIRLIGVGVSNLEDEVHQLSLFDKSFQKERMLLEAVDNLKERYGKEIIRKGSKKKK